MKNITLASLVVAAACGCAVLDNTLSRPVVTGEPGNYQTNWVVNPDTQAVGVAVGTLFPGPGTLAALALGIVSTAWTAWLNRRKKAALVATVEAVGEFRDGLKAAGDVGNKLDEKLVDTLELAHAHAGVSTMMQDIVDNDTAASDPRIIEGVNFAITGKPAP